MMPDRPRFFRPNLVIKVECSVACHRDNPRFLYVGTKYESDYRDEKEKMSDDTLLSQSRALTLYFADVAWKRGHFGARCTYPDKI